MGFDAIVLAGGAASRLGGTDKVELTVGDATLLARVLAAVDGATRTVVVGPERDGYPGVLWCRERPAGGGPLAAIAAGAARTDEPVVLVLAGDLPAIEPAVPALLAAVAAGADAATLTDAGGVRNPLASAWQRAALVAALAGLHPHHGRPARALFAQVPPVDVPDVSGWGTDCDTWDDLAAARRRAERGWA